MRVETYLFVSRTDQREQQLNLLKGFNVYIYTRV